VGSSDARNNNKHDAHDMIKMEHATVLRWYIYCTKYLKIFLFLHFYYQKQYYEFSNMNIRVIMRVSFFIQVKVVNMSLQAKDEHFSA
jgi:hypothetical protein